MIINSISIIIVTYERFLATKRCIESIQNQKDVNYKLIIIDNGSSNSELIKYLRSLDAKFILRRNNYGLYKSLNYGISLTNAKTIAFLDCDMVLNSSWLKDLQKELDSSPDIGLVGPRYINPDGTLQEGFPRLSKDGWYGLNKEEMNVPSDCQYIAIGASVFKREAWEKVHGFDEGYFISHGDIDFCYKLRYNGQYRVRYVPNISIIHDHEYGKEKIYESVRFNDKIISTDFELFKKKWKEIYQKE